MRLFDMDRERRPCFPAAFFRYIPTESLPDTASLQLLAKSSAVGAGGGVKCFA